MSAPLRIMVDDETVERWADDAVAFVLECIRPPPSPWAPDGIDPWQREVLIAATQNDLAKTRICLLACKGPGKSCVLSWLALWFLYTRPMSKVACTSITGDNLSAGLWAEIAKWMNASPQISSVFRWTTERVSHRDESYAANWFIDYRTWPKDADPTAQADSLAGLHADYVLFILDEVSNYPEGVVAAAEGAMASGLETRMIVAGNPTKTSGPLYRMAVRDKHHWWVKRITGDPDSPRRAPRVDMKWARDMIELWRGRDAPFVRTNVLGEFPLTATDRLLGADEVLEAMERDCKPDVYEDSPRVIGVDVARFGDDRTVFFPRQGRVAFQPRIYTKRDLMWQATALVEMALDWHADAVFIDTCGVGGGLYDRVMQLGRGMQDITISVNSANKPGDKRFKNMRALMQSKAADWIRDGGVLPDIGMLVEEATSAAYDFTDSGEMFLTDKEKIKALIGRSPDLWEALCQTFAAPVVSRKALQPEYRPIVQRRNGRRPSDYNPFPRAS